MAFEKGAKRRSIILLTIMAGVIFISGTASFRDPGSPLDSLITWLRPEPDLWPRSENVAVTPPISPAVGLVSAARQSADLVAVLDDLAYDLDMIKSGSQTVQPVFITQFPKDLQKATKSSERKDIFASVLLPLALYANHHILLQRQRMIEILARRDNGQILTDKDHAWLEALAKRYKADSDDKAALMNRVDIIPPSLIIAQAAVETAWGTSRFVRVGNAMFGQWTWDETQGILPLKRDPNKKHFIKAYPTLFASMTDYLRNLNSHKAYSYLRELRAVARAKGATPAGTVLANGLEKYSERGMDYVYGLQKLITRNGYQHFDTHARLGRDLVSRSIAANTL